MDPRRRETTRAALSALPILLAVLAGCSTPPPPVVAPPVVTSSATVPVDPSVVVPTPPGTDPGATGAGTASAPAVSTTAAVAYRTYQNTRFGYVVDVPASYREDDPPENGDGRGFTSPDGLASVSMAGENNALRRTVDEELAAVDSILSQDDTLVTYRVVEGDTITVSGLSASRRTIFYAVTRVQPSTIMRLEWTYPAAQKNALDAAVQRSADTFRPA